MAPTAPLKVILQPQYVSPNFEMKNKILAQVTDQDW